MQSKIIRRRHLQTQDIPVAAQSLCVNSLVVLLLLSPLVVVIEAAETLRNPSNETLINAEDAADSGLDHHILSTHGDENVTSTERSRSAENAKSVVLPVQNVQKGLGPHRSAKERATSERPGISATSEEAPLSFHLKTANAPSDFKRDVRRLPESSTSESEGASRSTDEEPSEKVVPALTQAQFDDLHPNVKPDSVLPGVTSESTNNSDSDVDIDLSAAEHSIDDSLEALDQTPPTALENRDGNGIKFTSTSVPPSSTSELTPTVTFYTSSVTNPVEVGAEDSELHRAEPTATQKLIKPEVSNKLLDELRLVHSPENRSEAASIVSTQPSSIQPDLRRRLQPELSASPQADQPDTEEEESEAQGAVEKDDSNAVGNETVGSNAAQGDNAVAAESADSSITAAAENTTDQMLLVEKHGMDLIPLESLLSGMLFALSASFMVVGGAIPYVFQYAEIHKRKSALGFSLLVCLALCVANILRILFWFGKRFEIVLLVQSVVMIGCMLLMLEIAVRMNKKITPPSQRKSVWKGHLISAFWKWNDLSSFVVALIGFTIISSFITWLFISERIFVEALGMVALLVEACLGLPQLIRNFQRRSTQGMSVNMVLMWLLGDIGKTIYFVVRKNPAQFYICSSLQITIDLLILGQVYFYNRGGARIPTYVPSTQVKM